MGFYFCGQYIHTDGDPKEVEWKMYAAVPTFRDFYDRYVMKTGKAILKLSSIIFL